jgi:hypothetical protein
MRAGIFGIRHSITICVAWYRASIFWHAGFSRAGINPVIDSITIFV